MFVAIFEHPGPAHRPVEVIGDPSWDTEEKVWTAFGVANFSYREIGAGAICPDGPYKGLVLYVRSLGAHAHRHAGDTRQLAFDIPDDERFASFSPEGMPAMPADLATELLPVTTRELIGRRTRASRGGGYYEGF